MDLNGGSDADCTKVQGYVANGSRAQKWKLNLAVVSEGLNYYTITNVRSSSVLDLNEGSSSNGTPVQGYTANQTDAQRWTFLLQASGSYKVQNLGGGTVLDLQDGSATNGTQIQGYQNHNSKTQ
eukprot:gene43465-53982_t